MKKPISILIFLQLSIFVGFDSTLASQTASGRTIRVLDTVSKQWSVRGGPLSMHGTGQVSSREAESVKEFEAYAESLSGYRALRELFDARLLVPNFAEAVLYESPGNTRILGYPLEATGGALLIRGSDENTVSMNYALQGRVEYQEFAFHVVISADISSGAIRRLVLRDVLFGESIDYDFAGQLVSCPTFENCILNCVVDKLCGLLEPCELGILAFEVAACVTTGVGCVALLDDLVQVVFCTGVDCVAGCSSGEGSCSNPIDLSGGGAFSGDTSGGQSSFDSYSCVSWDESGPERVHRVVVNTSGLIGAQLSGLSVDLDVFILSSCSADSCIAHGNNAVSADVGPGTYFVVVDGFLGAEGSYELNVTAPGGGSPGILDEDVESGINGWNASGLWNISTSRNQSPTHSWYYGQPSSMNYDTGAANSGTLTSPPVVLGSLSNPSLEFFSWHHTENGSTWDRKLIQVSADNGASWTGLAQITDTQQQWTERSYSLSPWQGQTIRIRFVFDTGDNILNAFEGWYLDDIKVVGN